MTAFAPAGTLSRFSVRAARALGAGLVLVTTLLAGCMGGSYGAPKITKDPADASAFETQTATFTFGAEGAAPLAIQWKRNGVNVIDGPGGASPSGGAVSGAAGTLNASSTLTTLTIVGAKRSDAGAYSVTFTNVCGTVESSAFGVIIGCPADLDGDGVVDSNDLGLLLSAWGTGSNDITDDGLIDGADLGLLLWSWGRCPG